MLDLRNLSVAINAVQILRGVTLSVPDRAMVGLVGRNGAGKTTLMKTLMGLLKPAEGAVQFDGRDLRAAPARALMCGTRLLVLDEPFEGVAPALAQRLAEVIANLKREGMSVLLSESDLQHSERLVDRVVVIDRGAIASGA